MVLVAVWGLRLSGFLCWRNIGHGEDFRYQKFRANFGDGYWWYSFFQVFLFQGVLMVLISTPLLGAQLGTTEIGFIDAIAIAATQKSSRFFMAPSTSTSVASERPPPQTPGKRRRLGFRSRAG